MEPFSPTGSGSEPDDFFTFEMGEYTAKFPVDREYVSNHMWAKSESEGICKFGLTSYAVRLLQDVYFLDWLVEPPVGIVSRQHMGSIESKKAESDLFSPAAGQLVELNESVLDDPSLINAEPYEGGWLFAMRLADESGLMNPQGYSEHLVKAWEVAQRTIKGQANL